jgi:hypothetical protein
MGTKNRLETYCKVEAFDDFSYKAKGDIKSLKEDVGLMLENRLTDLKSIEGV